MKKISLYIIGFLVSFCIFSLAIFYYFWASSPACYSDCPSQIFIIKKGESFTSVANRLEQEGLIRSALVFHLVAWQKGTINKIQAGSFRLSSQMTPSLISQTLTKGTLDIWVTILEGWRREEIGAKLAKAGLKNFKIEDFLKLTADLEGQLFPDTYLIPQEADAAAVVAILNKNFQKKVSSVSQETLILASIVEREVSTKKDRQIVAGILWKRLQKNWPLQADATVQYALASARCKNYKEECDWWPKALSKNDLTIKSSFNTYQVHGLPPSPICNPGLASIEAALTPIATDYWFYLSDSSGEIHYAKTDSEQAENIRKYLLQE